MQDDDETTMWTLITAQIGPEDRRDRRGGGPRDRDNRVEFSSSSRMEYGELDSRDRRGGGGGGRDSDRSGRDRDADDRRGGGGRRRRDARSPPRYDGYK